MVYNIDEKQLRYIIEDVVKNTVKQILINEMAFNLSSYRNKIEDMIDQIIINWCLIRYTVYDERYARYRNHWSSELFDVMKDISRMRLKKGNNIETKMKALYSVWNEFEYDTDESTIDNAISYKFRSEGIDTTSNEYIQTVSDCKNATKDIIDTLLSESNPKISKYIRTI